jgi:hypothetical protein
VPHLLIDEQIADESESRATNHGGAFRQQIQQHLDACRERTQMKKQGVVRRVTLI